MNLKSFSAGHNSLHIKCNGFFSGANSGLPADHNNELIEAGKVEDEERNPHPDYDHLTPAELRYIEQKQKIDMQKLAKVANKSHRDRIQDFNQYLANLSEHYDIPKVGPG
jgi:protein FAM32A